MDLYQELLNKKSYAPIFDLLNEKAKKTPHRLRSHPVKKELSLEWALAAEEDIIKYLTADLRKRKYFPQSCSQNLVMLDRERTLYSLCWPDRIFELLLAKKLSEAFEPHHSPRLFSYRKGLNNHVAVRQLSAFVRERCSASAPLYVLKRDVAHYCETVDIPMLLEQIRAILGEQTPYIWSLIGSFMQPRYFNSIENYSAVLELGLPTGYALTTVCANLYLGELDRVMAEQPGAFYSRYGDDIALLHPDPDELNRLDLKMTEIVGRLKLAFNQEKKRDFVLAAVRPANSARFRQVQSFDYLGFNVSLGGQIFISQKKLNSFKSELRRMARYAFLANRRQAASRDELCGAIVNSLNVFFKKQLEQPYVGLMLATVTNLAALKELDKWIAKQVLRYIYKTGHDRVFRHESYQTLRRRGLTSMVRLKNLKMRGQ